MAQEINDARLQEKKIGEYKTNKVKMSKLKNNAIIKATVILLLILFNACTDMKNQTEEIINLQI